MSIAYAIHRSLCHVLRKSWTAAATAVAATTTANRTLMKNTMERFSFPPFCLLLPVMYSMPVVRFSLLVWSLFLREINFMAKCKQIHFYETNENHNFFPWNFTTHGILFLLHTHISHEFDKWWAHHTESGTHKNDLTTVPNASFDTSQILKLRSLCMHIVHVIAIIEDSYSLYNRQQLKLYRANAVPSRSEKEGGGSVWMKSYAKLFFLSRFIFHYANTWYFNTM